MDPDNHIEWGKLAAGALLNASLLNAEERVRFYLLFIAMYDMIFNASTQSFNFRSQSIKCTMFYSNYILPQVRKYNYNYTKTKTF